jgi:hypothetical protein
MASLLNGSNTWMSKDCGLDQFAKIKNLKLSMTPEKLCTGMARGLLPFATEVFGYAFNEEPNYAKLKFMLVQILLDVGKVPDAIMDWSKHPKIKEEI